MFLQLTKTFLKHVVATVNMEEPAELVVNWDQTGIKIVPSSMWPMVEHVQSVLRWLELMINARSQLLSVDL